MTTTAQKASFFVPENLLSEKEYSASWADESRARHYKLVVGTYKTKPGCWDYTRGQVFDTDTNEIIANVQRNYGHFDFEWILGHSNGHDYLVCGEDYQGQTVIELDTGKRCDFLPPEAKQGRGFCWSRVKASPNKKYLAVSGCYWGGPYEAKVLDFRQPLYLPYIQLAETDEPHAEMEWVDDSSLNLIVEKEVRKSDGKLLHELSSGELDEVYKNDDYFEKKESVLWKAISHG